MLLKLQDRRSRILNLDTAVLDQNIFMFKWPSQSLSIPSIIFIQHQVREATSPGGIADIPLPSNSGESQSIPGSDRKWTPSSEFSVSSGSPLSGTTSTSRGGAMEPSSAWQSSSPLKLISSTRIMNHDPKNQIRMSWPKVWLSSFFITTDHSSAGITAGKAPIHLPSRLNYNHDPRRQTSNQAVNNVGGHSWKKPTEPHRLQKHRDETMFQNQMSSSPGPSFRSCPETSLVSEVLVESNTQWEQAQPVDTPVDLKSLGFYIPQNTPTLLNYIQLP